MEFNGKQINKIHRIVLVGSVPSYDIKNRVVIQYGNLSSTFEKFDTFEEAEDRFRNLFAEIRVNTKIGNWVKAETASWEPEGFELKFSSKEEYEAWEK